MNNLKKNLEKHYTEHLKIRFPVSFIDITKIAKTGDRQNLMILIELVVGAILSYQSKELYISKILTLDVRIQSELMEFITKIFKKIDQTSEKEQNTQNLKTENRNLKLQIEDLNNTLQEIVALNEGLTIENKELTQQKQALEDSFESKNLKRLPTELNLPFLEAQMISKDSKILELTQKLELLQTKSEASTSQIQDELDIAHEKLADYNKTKSDLELYKKRLEDHLPYKKKAAELSILNQRLAEELKSHEKDTNSLFQTQGQIKNLKEQLENAKNQCESLKYNLEQKEILYKEIIKNKKELEEAKNFFEQQSKDLLNEIDQMKSFSDRDRDSFTLQATIERDYEDQKKRIKDLNQKLNVQNGIIQGLNQELEKILYEKTLLSKKIDEAISEKEKVHKNMQEVIEKNNELKNQLNAKTFSFNYETENLKEKNKKLALKIENLKKKLESMNELAEHNKKLETEKETEKQNFKKEIKEIYQEKQKFYEKIEEINVKNFDLQQELKNKNEIVESLQIQIKKLQDFIEELNNSQENLLSKIKIYEETPSVDQIHESQINYANEISAQNTLLLEKEEKILTLQEEKQTLMSYYEDRLKLENERITKQFLYEKYELSEVLEKKNKELTELEHYKIELTNSWNQEIRFFSMMFHEIGLEHMKAAVLLKKEKKER